jgi:PAS domain-containing protein
LIQINVLSLADWGSTRMDGRLELADSLLEAALAAVSVPGNAMAEALDALPAPVYITDADGRITHYNQACIGFAGRTPGADDRWCVTWKLFTLDGDALPHDACPMAVAIKERRPVRNVEALAERPDGSRVRFQPFPTPLFDAEGSFRGAINLMIDVTDIRRADELRIQAARCRRLANSVLDRQTLDSLKGLAEECDAEAERLSRLH